LVIAQFVIIFAFRFIGIGLIRSQNFNIGNDKFLVLNNIGTFFTIEQLWFSFFMLCALLRALKFAKIEPTIGPVSAAILKTARSSSLIVFLLVFFFIFFSFCISFQLSFGFTAYDFRDLPSTIIILMRVLFGDFQALLEVFASNQLYGPLLILLFVFVMVILLLTILIAVVSATYNTKFLKNKTAWDQNITYLLVKNSLYSYGRLSTFDWVYWIFKRGYILILHCCKRKKLERASRRNTLTMDDYPVKPIQLTNSFSDEDFDSVAREIEAKLVDAVPDTYNYKQLNALETQLRDQRTSKSTQQMYQQVQVLRTELDEKLEAVVTDLAKQTNITLRNEVAALRHEITQMKELIEHLARKK